MDNGLSIGGIGKALVAGFILPAALLAKACEESGIPLNMWEDWKKLAGLGKDANENGGNGQPKRAPSQPEIQPIDTMDNGSQNIDDISPAPAAENANEQEEMVAVPEQEAANIIVQFFGSIKTIGDVASRIKLMWGIIKHPKTSDNCKNTIVAEMKQREGILRQIAQKHFTQGGESAMGLLDNFFQYVDNYAKSEDKQKQIAAIAAQLKENNIAKAAAPQEFGAERAQ